MIQPSVPELTLLCDGESAMSSTATHQQYDSAMTSGYITSEWVQSACSHAANTTEEAVGSNGSLSSVNSPQPLIQSSGVTQQTARQPPIHKKLCQPVTGRIKGVKNNVTTCCHRCTTCQTNTFGVAEITPYVAVCAPDKCGSQNGSCNVPRTADNFVGSSTPAYPPTNVSIQLSASPSNVHNSVLSPDCSAGSQRMQNGLPMVAVSSAPRVPVQHCQSCCLTAEPPAMAMHNEYSSTASSGSRHVVEAIPSSSSTGLPCCPPSHNGQPATTGPWQNGEFHQYSLQQDARFVSANHRHCMQGKEPSYDITGRSRAAQSTPQHPVMPTRLPLPATQPTSRDAVARQAQQPCHTPCPHSSCLPLNVKCASRGTIDQSDGHHCSPCISPCIPAEVMRCTESHQFSTLVLAANQHGELSGGSKAVQFHNHPGAQLLEPKSNTRILQQGVIHDSNQYASRDNSALINESRHSQCRIDLQQLPEVSVPMSSAGRTVNDLLSTIPVQYIDWSMSLPHGVAATVDGFVESVLGYKSASTDSGLQVNDSAVTGETAAKMLHHSATYNCDSMLPDVGGCATSSQYGTFKQPVKMQKCTKVDAEPAVHEHLEYIQDKPNAAERFSSRDNRPNLCSVAVNTSFCWPAADNGRTQHWHNAPCSDKVPNKTDAICLDNTVASYIDDTIQPAGNIAVQSSRGCAANDSPGVNVSHRLLVSDTDIELVDGSSPGACDSMADVSLCTPPPPIFANPSEESVVSEMIMDMPEYTALSHEK